MLRIGERPVAVTVGAVVQASLRTTCIADAKLRHSEADSALKRYREAIRAGERSLTQREIVALAGEFYDATKRCIDADRSRDIPRVVEEASRVGTELKSRNTTFEAQRDIFIAHLEETGTPAEWAKFGDPADIPVTGLEAGFGAQAGVLLRQKGSVADAKSCRLSMQELYRAVRLAADIEMGFQEFVKQKGLGPLFYEPVRNRRGEKSTRAQMIGK